eukprot:SM000080S22908  [mRNA]  locus=s80:55583:58352:+ [translate_table: standard]
MAETEWHARAPNAKNPVVFFDVTIGGVPAGRVKMELFADVAPRTAENFRKASLPVGYKGCSFHRVIRGFMIQGGDFLKKPGAHATQGDGSGTVSIYGTKFDDENFVAKHTGPGLLSSADEANDFVVQTVVPTPMGARPRLMLLCDAQFFITCGQCDWLDNKHVVFGRVVGEGLLVVRKIENVQTGPNNRPKLACVITECGEM